MAFSTIKLYYGTEQNKWKLTPNKLMVVEDIEEYLNGFDYLAIANYQYVKNDIALTLKFDLSQRFTDPLINDGIKYVYVQNSDTTRPVYYYVDNAEWRGKECVRLTLSMDILNTFKYGIDYKLSDKTKITRQHKDRLFKDGLYLKRTIDKVSEDINPNLYKYEEHKINGDGHKWYLIYMNENAPSESLTNPIKCLLCADTEINAQPFGSEANGRITPPMLTNGYYYYVASLSVQFTLDDGTIIKRASSSSQWRVQMYKKDSVINIVVIDGTQIGTTISYVKRVFTTAFVQFSENFSMSYTTENSFNVSPYRDYPTTFVGNTQFYVDGAPLVRIAPISELDRTNAKLIKVIELPYCVDDFEYNGDTLLVNSNWLYVRVDGFNALQLANLNTKFELLLKDTINPLNELRLFRATTNIVPTDARNDELESKIYNSEFASFKFVYDSFTFNYDLEKIDITQTINFGLSNIKFNVSNTINGKMLFTFIDYLTGAYSTQDYNNIVCVSRNNDIALYNVAYINYIRNGYNYDIKNKNRTQENALVGTILGAIGTIGAFASSVYTGGFGIAMGVSMATTTTSQIYNLVNTIKSSEEALQQKQEQLKNQSASVSGSDDIDLLNVYTDGNKAKWVYYRPSTQMLKVLYDLFYYCGYADNIQATPVINTRCWFNFVACDIVIDYTNNMNNTMVEQLKTMFATGITFMHHYNGAWDIDQVKNNVEISLLS